MENLNCPNKISIVRSGVNSFYKLFCSVFNDFHSLDYPVCMIVDESFEGLQQKVLDKIISRVGHLPFTEIDNSVIACMCFTYQDINELRSICNAYALKVNIPFDVFDFLAILRKFQRYV